MLRLLTVMGCLVLRTGCSSESKLKAPELNIKEKEHVIQAEQTLHLQCRGGARHTWTLPETLNKSSKMLTINKYACGRQGKQFCSSLALSKAHANHTGYYSCKYSSSATPPKKKNMETRVYVFINDNVQPFVKIPSATLPDVAFYSEGEPLIIPCRVTAPNVTVSLKKKIPPETFEIDGKVVIWDNKQGFIVPEPMFKFSGLLICETNINGNVHQSKYMTQKQSFQINAVRMKVLKHKLLRGESLAMNCTVSAGWNTRAQFTWTYPGKATKRARIKQRIIQKENNIIYSSLVIDQVADIDKGLYICHVKGGKLDISVKKTVRVYEKPFINVKPRWQGALEAVAGQKSFRLAMKVNAFPPPEILWYKDDLLAAERCARYIVNGHILTIKDVSEEDSGSYTIVLKIPQWNLTKALTSNLTVNVKPQIYEKAVSFQDPYLYPLGSKQTLTCTVYGVPPPTIKWTWRPCRHNPSKPRCDFRSNATRSSFLLESGSRKGNQISISERVHVIEGKNKTTGTLVVAESKSSGVYICEATNKIGTDSRSINFYVTDVLHGFHISLDRALPREGDNVTVTCTVNKYLYTDISWRFLRTVQNRTITHVVNEQKNSLTGVYSTNQTFLIKNASQEDSGTIVCQAKNVITGDEVNQRKDITIRGEHWDKKAPLSWTSKCKGTRSNCTTQSVVNH